MAEIGITPHYYRGTVTIDSNGYTKQLGSCVLKPTPKTAVWTAIDESEVPLAGKSSWTLDVLVAQDHATANSLSLILLEDEGSIVDATMTTADGATLEFTITLVAGDIGGTPGQIASAQISFPASYPVLADAE